MTSSMMSRCSATRANMQLFRLLCVIAFALLPMSLCRAQGVAFRVVKSVEPFNAITVAPNINVTLVMSDEAAMLPNDVVRRVMDKKGALIANRLCVARGEPTVIKAVECSVEGNSLTISAAKFKFKKSKRIDVYVVCDTALTLIHGTSGGNIQTRGCLRMADVTIKADYAQDIHIGARANSVRVVAANHSSVRLTGNAQTVDATLSSASKLTATSFTTQSMSLSAADESRANIVASESANISASRRSTVRIRSTPTATININKDESSQVVVEK